MKGKYFIIGGAGVIIVALILFSVLNIGKVGAVEQTTSRSSNVLGNLGDAVAQNSGEVQEVTLSMKNYQYIVEPTVLKKGVPVRMTVDMKTVV